MLSIQRLKFEYKDSNPFFKKDFLKEMFVGSFANAFYTKCSVGPEARTYLKINKMAKLKSEYVSYYKGVLVKKTSKSAKILGNFRGFFFYKTFMLDSPMTLTLGITLKKAFFLKKRSNIFNFLKPGHKFYKKAKKLK